MGFGSNIQAILMLAIIASIKRLYPLTAHLWHLQTCWLSIELSPACMQSGTQAPTSISVMVKWVNVLQRARCMNAQMNRHAEPESYRGGPLETRANMHSCSAIRWRWLNKLDWDLWGGRGLVQWGRGGFVFIGTISSVERSSNEKYRYSALCIIESNDTVFGKFYKCLLFFFFIL